MLLPSRVAGRTLGLRGPDLARGPEVARLCTRGIVNHTILFKKSIRMCALRICRLRSSNMLMPLRVA